MKLCRNRIAIVLICLLLVGIVPTAQAADGAGFSDVSSDAWYAEAVTWCEENGMMGGTSITEFSPDAVITRARLAAVLWCVECKPEVDFRMAFTDVAGDSQAAEAIRWAASEKIMSGYDAETFGSEDPVTREQLATILWRYAGCPATGQCEDFADEAMISGYAVEAANWARANRIICGMGENRFEPSECATRAQVAMLLYRYLTESEGMEPASGKILVAYFSRAGENCLVGHISEGNTAVIARIIAEQTGGDLFEILPVIPYPDSYEEMLTVAQQEAETDARPEISNSVPSMDQYDTIFIGYPVWNKDLPKIIYTFLESYDFTGKTVIPFNTHEGSGQSGTQEAIETMLQESTVLDGLAIRGTTAQNDQEQAAESVQAWLNGLGLSS